MPVLTTQPESPMTERLRFLTDILTSKDGSEQRVNLRIDPRIEFDFTLLVENHERAKYENKFFGALRDEWTVPLWADVMILTADASSGSGVLNVDSSSFIDFRDGDSVMVWADDDTNEILTNCSVAGTVITADSDTLTGNYSAGSMVYIVRSATLAGNVQVSRYNVNLTKFDLTYRMNDSLSDLSDITDFTLLNGLPIISDPNFIEGNLEESWEQPVTIVDSGTGVFTTGSYWDRAKRNSAKTFKTKTRSILWRVRKLLYYMQGQQQTFWLPTFGQDLILNDDIGSADTVLSVENSGYATYTQSRSPRNKIRIILTNGTAYTKNVTLAAELDATTEHITIDSPLGVAVGTGEIDRVEILELVRSATDDFVIKHQDGLGQASISFPVRTVFETP
jgi:hypothetical protein